MIRSTHPDPSQKIFRSGYDGGFMTRRWLRCSRVWRPFRGFLAGVGVMVVVATGSAAVAQVPDQIDELRRRQESLRAEQEELTRAKADKAADINALAIDDQRLVESLAAIDSFVALQEARITSAEVLIAEAEADAAVARAEAERLMAEIGSIEERLRKRAVDAFVQPPNHAVDPLASDDLSQTAVRRFLLNHVIGDELEIVDDLRRAEAALGEVRRIAFERAAEADAERKVLSVRLVELEQSRADAERLRAEVQARIVGLEQEAAEIDAADQAIAEEVDRLEARERQIRAEIERERLAEIERKRREAEEARRKAAEQERRRLAEAGNPDDFILVAWPADGEITSGFGPRIHPIFGVSRNHNGIDIGGDTGDPVRAALVGEVIIAGWRNGYGKTVVLNHYDGYSTLYAHMSKISVSVGDEIKHGNRLGSLGSTGWSTGPHLHFELRKEGTAIDPRPFLP